jgi:co-chaperonin GroES (HSP10)
VSLRAVGDRVLLKRVHERSALIAHVHETLGVTDRVMQFGEVVGMGPEWTTGKYRHIELKAGDLVVYPSPRVHDHFTWRQDDNTAVEVLVIPGYWVSAIVTGTFLAEHPELREYGTPLV